MIDFACKEFEIDAVVKCSLNLTRADLQILKYFIENDEKYHTAENISTSLNFDLSTAQKTVKKLHEKQILIRLQSNLDGGGYVFVYKVKSKKEIKDIIMSTVQSWIRRLENELEIWADDK
ncbi:transcriptional regulator, TrmB [Methanosalsum zhilinae DSM 4017]|uniref:Transcriptional regulator, TrmB n=1 Tax=Methanosalsum zhilinae (strain DSM 4017 / NBRC 107636 / OCM 62 / WeN5) TaxID=679901 RepID=F7XLG0_METZD|nr:TrmB family transcriptional regulator [Methanosalsum zhilinae]AEH60562.1 transcriptional regulator, TrmB [Methanosalsum zhilinae DSM 4017]